MTKEDFKHRYPDNSWYIKLSQSFYPYNIEIKIIIYSKILLIRLFVKIFIKNSESLDYK